MGPVTRQPPPPSPTSAAPPITAAAVPDSRASHATMPVMVLLPLVPLTATPGCAVLTSSARSAGRDRVVRPSARGAHLRRFCLDGRGEHEPLDGGADPAAVVRDEIHAGRSQRLRGLAVTPGVECTVGT